MLSVRSQGPADFSHQQMSAFSPQRDQARGSFQTIAVERELLMGTVVASAYYRCTRIPRLCRRRERLLLLKMARLIAFNAQCGQDAA